MAQYSCRMKEIRRSQKGQLQLRMKKIWIVVLVFGLTACNGYNKLLKSTDYNLKLKKADEFFADKKYVKAQTLYEDVMPVLSGTPQYEEVYYKWAYSTFYQKDYLNAENIFKTFLERFPQSKFAEEMEYMRAYSLYKMSPKPELDQTNTTRAITFLQTFINGHPNSDRGKEAERLLDELRGKLETKDFKSAELYYNLGYYRAAATAFNELMFNFPDSDRGDYYKLKVIESFYKFAANSLENLQEERFETVLNEAADFSDRFPESKLVAEVDKIRADTEKNINRIKNEQTAQTNGG